MTIRPAGHYRSDLKYERENMIRVAGELHYSSSVIEKLKQAKSTNELSRIMTNARKGGM